MFLTTLIAFISLISLVILHELGHFLLAKKFGVKVEEFGIGYPPRLFGKKIGETVYSINLLPFGAFVRLPGEIERVKDRKSFSQQPVGKRALIVLGGVLSFWVIAAIIFSIIFNLGAPVAIDDESNSNLIDPKVQIAGVSPRSPAKIVGLRLGDTIKQLSVINEQLSPTKIKEVQKFTNAHLGEEVTLTIERGKETFEVSLFSRISPPEGEGPMGVALVRTAIKKYPWYMAPWQGILTTGNLTLSVVRGYARAIGNVFRGVPSGVQIAGPVRIIFEILPQAQQMGITYFMNFLGLISVYLAILNILPIPAFDGGKLLFLGIEAIRKKPVSQKIEQSVTAFFFSLLILLMIWVTIRDITKLF